MSGDNPRWPPFDILVSQRTTICSMALSREAMRARHSWFSQKPGRMRASLGAPIAVASADAARFRTGVMTQTNEMSALPAGSHRPSSDRGGKGFEITPRPARAHVL
jgi:hypothetical protein